MIEFNFPRAGGRRRAEPLSGEAIDFAALVAGLVATQALSLTARVEELAARPRATDSWAHAALLQIFAPRRNERGGRFAAMAGSFHLATARAIASTSEQPG
jgi:hypothetical protein